MWRDDATWPERAGRGAGIRGVTRQRRVRAGIVAFVLALAMNVGVAATPALAQTDATVHLTPGTVGAGQYGVTVSVTYRTSVRVVATLSISVPATWARLVAPQLTSRTRPGFVTLSRGRCDSTTRIVEVVRASSGAAVVRIASACGASTGWSLLIQGMRAPGTVGRATWTIAAASSGTTTVLARPVVTTVPPWPNVPPAPTGLPACFTTGAPAVSYGCWVTTVAGTGPPTLGDGGPATRAVLQQPSSAAIGPDGTLYIVDRADDRIRAVSPAGVIRTVVGTGSAEFAGTGDGGPALAATLRFPSDVVVTPDGGLLIADTNHYLVRRVDPAGTISSVAGNRNPYYAGDGGPALSASFGYPVSLDYDAAGNIYVADNTANRVRRIDGAGTITTIGGDGRPGTGGDGGAASAAQIDSPAWLRVDRAHDLLYVTQTGTPGPYIVRRIDLRSGRITTVPGLVLHSPSFAIDSAGNLVVGGPFGPQPTLQHVDGQTGRAVATVALAAAVGGGPAVIDSQGGVVFVDPERNVVTRVSPSGVTRVVAGPGVILPTLARARSVPFYDSQGLAFDGHGDLYVGDFDHNVIRRIAPDGTITTVAGTGVWGSSGNGGPPLRAQLAQPGSLAFDSHGDLLFLTVADGTGVVWMITPGADGVIDGSADERIVAIAGQAVDRQHADHGAADGHAATSAVFDAARGLCVDGANNVYVADTYDQRIRKITPGPDGILDGGSDELISTVAGTGAAVSSGDGGPAAAAGVVSPHQLYCAPNGDLYVRAGDYLSSIRRIDERTGIISTYLAALQGAQSFSVDAAGNVYYSVTDQNGYSQLLRRDAASGLTAVVAGVGPAGYSGDGGSAPAAAFASIAVFTWGPDGALYIPDNGNFRLRRVAFTALAPAGP